MRFGKRPARRNLKTLAMGNYMNASQVPCPARWAWERPIPYGMLLNDQLGDCVIAGCSHLEMNWQAVAHAGDAPFVPTDAQVIADYGAVGGYVPGQPSTDNGCDMLTAMQYGLRTGFGGRPPWQTFATLDTGNVDQVKAATYLFGGVPIGINVPQSMVDQLNAGQDPTWATVPGDTASGEGHCVLVVGYGRSGFALVSWGKVYRTSWAFWEQWTDEAYAAVSRDWLKTSGIAPSGVDLDGLIADTQSIVSVT